MSKWNRKKYMRNICGLRPGPVRRVGDMFSLHRDIHIPQFQDYRAFHSATDNQGNNPSCATCSVSNYFEVENFIRTDILGMRYDFLKWYNVAKELDGDDLAGTTLDQAVNAGKKLGFVSPERKIVHLKSFREIAWALKNCRSVPAGFMITRNWFYPDGNGFIPENRADPIGGHAVNLDSYHIYLKRKSADLQDESNWNTGKSWIGHHGSWSNEYAINGHARMSLDLFNQQFMDAIYVAD